MRASNLSAAQTDCQPPIHQNAVQQNKDGTSSAVLSVLNPPHGAQRNLAGLPHIDDVASHVVAALGAYRMGRNSRAALWAVTGLLWLDLMMRATLAAT